MDLERIDYLEKIEDELNRAEVLFFMDDDETGTTFVIDILVCNVWELQVFLTLRNKDVIDLRCYIETEMEDDVSDKILPVLNDLNTSNRFVCFAIDEENRIYVDYSCLIYGDPKLAAKNVVTMLVMMMYVLEESVPLIMNTIWEEE